MNATYFIITVLTLFLLGIQGCTKSTITVTEEISRAEYEKRRLQIIEFFSKRQTRYEVVATTKTKSGQIIDWIKPESQVPGGRIAAPPPEQFAEIRKPISELENPYLDTSLPQALQELKRQDASARTELQLDESAMGPKGTVPVVRFDVESYLKENPTYLPKDPIEILTKVPPPDPASNDRYYVFWQRFGDVFGSIGRINIWNTTGPVGGETSIAQVAVIRGDPMQAVEAGKIEHSSFAPSKRPTFFTYFRTSGAASGDWVGGYNALVDG
ncbi:MAG: hypothetical protein ACREOB_03845, partial [Thermodesulfobacteriota bacterium]